MPPKFAKAVFRNGIKNHDGYDRNCRKEKARKQFAWKFQNQICSLMFFLITWWLSAALFTRLHTQSLVSRKINFQAFFLKWNCGFTFLEGCFTCPSVYLYSYGYSPQAVSNKRKIYIPRCLAACTPLITSRAMVNRTVYYNLEKRILTNLNNPISSLPWQTSMTIYNSMNYVKQA